MRIFPAFHGHALLRTVVLFMLLGLPATVQGQGGPSLDGLGVGSGAGMGSRFPLRVKLGGMLNPTTLRADSIKVATLSISGYRETYQFEITEAEAVDDKQIPRAVIVPRIAQSAYDFRVVGTKGLLSKIGQSLPNTPVSMIGFLRQRKSELILEGVETISAHPLAPEEQVDTEEVSPRLSPSPVQAHP